MSRPSQAQIARRRALAVVAAVAATVLVWFVFLGGGDETGGEGPQAPGGEVPAAVRDLVAELSPEEKVDGILLLGFNGTGAEAPIVSDLGQRQLGGVLVGNENWLDSSQLEALVEQLRSAGAADDRIGPLIATRQEGGPFRAFPDLPPSQRSIDIGDAGDTELAQASAREAGLALRDLGFDLNLFPVADVATIDSPVADRAYSDDPAVVAALTAAAIRGCKEAGIACAPSHFPGLGAASQSTDEGPATVSLDLTGLAARDLAPFETAFVEGAPAVVISHAFYVAYDAVTPASLSSLVTFELLREDLGFKGVAITDDLAAGAIKARGSASDAGGGTPQGGSAVTAGAIAAVQAGADLLMISSPGDQDDVTDALIEAVGTGEISEDRLDEAVGRVLLLKQELGLIPES